MPEHILGSQAQRVDDVWRKNLAIKDFSSLPKDFVLEQVVLQMACAGNGPT
jgi:hypothetical protein